MKLILKITRNIKVYEYKKFTSINSLIMLELIIYKDNRFKKYEEVGW